MKQGILLTDICSVLKGKIIYGKAGDTIKVIHESGEILIVEGNRWVEEKGKYVLSGIHRYSINKNQIKQ